MQFLETPAIVDQSAGPLQLRVAMPSRGSADANLRHSQVRAEAVVAALVERGGAQGVFTVDGGTASFQRVETSGLRDGRPIVAAGVEEGARVVAAPGGDLADGAAVNVEGEGTE